MKTKTQWPKHKDSCTYTFIGGICDCGVKHNGELFSHFQKMARRMVIDTVLRAVIKYDHNNHYISLPQHLAAEELKDILGTLDQDLVQEALKERTNSILGLPLFIKEILGSLPDRRESKKHNH